MSELELVDALAVRYRPRLFSEIIGNTKNVGIITGYFVKRQLVKSWLLSGNSGSGKTTTARVMAMAVNCQNMEKGTAEPCLECDSCKMALTGSHPDIKEMNAGSGEGKIAGVEATLDTIKFKPRFTCKVIIIDEAHLMTPKAAQSILKVLEEPPARVMWILATTDPNKLPPPMLGRCVKLYFEYPPTRETAKRLYRISKKEYDPDVVARIKPYLIPIAEATFSQVRNALSITESMANIVIGNPDIEDEQLKTLFKDILLDAGDVTLLAVRFVTHVLNESYGLPLSIINELEQTRIDEFVTLTSRYAHYAATYYTYDFTPTLGLGEFRKSRQKFYGVNFDRFDTALSKMKDKLIAVGLSQKEIVRRALCISAGLIEATEKLRTSVITREQALIYGINYFALKIGEEK
jgi:DNA polymerase III subunit gamma/tau